MTLGILGDSHDQYPMLGYAVLALRNVERVLSFIAGISARRVCCTIWSGYPQVSCGETAMRIGKASPLSPKRMEFTASQASARSKWPVEASSDARRRPCIDERVVAAQDCDYLLCGHTNRWRMNGLGRSA